MARPLIVLAVLFAVAIGLAGALLSMAERRGNRDEASRSVVPNADQVPEEGVSATSKSLARGEAGGGEPRSDSAASSAGLAAAGDPGPGQEQATARKGSAEAPIALNDNAASPGQGSALGERQASPSGKAAPAMNEGVAASAAGEAEARNEPPSAREPSSAMAGATDAVGGGRPAEMNVAVVPDGERTASAEPHAAPEIPATASQAERSGGEARPSTGVGSAQPDAGGEKPRAVASADQGSAAAALEAGPEELGHPARQPGAAARPSVVMADPASPASQVETADAAGGDERSDLPDHVDLTMPAAGEMTMGSNEFAVASAAEFTSVLPIAMLGSELALAALPVEAAAAESLAVRAEMARETAAGVLSPDLVMGSGELAIASAAELTSKHPVESLGSEIAFAAPTIGVAAAKALHVPAALSREAAAATVSAAKAAAAHPAVTIKAAEMESGTIYIAGEAPPGTRIRVYADRVFIGEARAGEEGVWLLEAQADIRLGEVVLRADVVSELAFVPIVQAETAFTHFADGVVLEPANATITANRDLALATADAPAPAYILIRRGDNLWRIARRNYGRGVKYKAIFEANRDRIRNPDLIFPGQVFVIPTRDRSWTSATN